MLTHAWPTRPSTWLLGDRGSIQVWAVEGDPRVQVSVLIGQGSPIVLLNRLIAGTDGEYSALTWALGKVATSTSGFFILAG